MFTPSLAYLISLAAPLIVFVSSREGNLWRLYTLASVPLFIAATLATNQNLNTNVLALATGQVSELAIPAKLYLALGLLMLTCAGLVWLQTLRHALHFPRLTRWLVAPLGLAAASIAPLGFSSVYIIGVIKWEFAPLPIKALGIFGIVTLGLAALALVAFTGQLLLSALRRKRAR